MVCLGISVGNALHNDEHVPDKIIRLVEEYIGHTKNECIVFFMSELFKFKRDQT